MLLKGLKLTEWILSDSAHCDKIAGMTIGEFRAEPARRNIEVTDAALTKDKAERRDCNDGCRPPANKTMKGRLLQ